MSKLINLGDFSSRIAHRQVEQSGAGAIIEQGMVGIDIIPDQFERAHQLLDEMEEEAGQAFDDLADAIRVPMHQVHAAAHEAMADLSLADLCAISAAASARFEDEGLTMDEEIVDQIVENEIARRQVDPKGAA